MTPDEFEEWADWVDGELDEAEDEAFEAGNVERLLELYERAWDTFPGKPDKRLQGVVSSIMGMLHDLGAWEAALDWLPRYIQVYGADEPSSRFHQGVVTWHTGEKARGQHLLAELYEEYRGSAFLTDPTYVAIALGESQPAPPSAALDDWDGAEAI